MAKIERTFEKSVKSYHSGNESFLLDFGVGTQKLATDNEGEKGTRSCFRPNLSVTQVVLFLVFEGEDFELTRRIEYPQVII